MFQALCIRPGGLCCLESPNNKHFADGFYDVHLVQPQEVM